MKEETEEKTETISPPSAAGTRGDTSPYIIGNRSPVESILHKPTTPLRISGDDHDESKRLAEGFLSEVSTPDCDSNNGQDGVTSAEKKNEHQGVFKLSPSKLLPAAYNELNVVDACKTNGADFPRSPIKAEEISGDLLRSPKISTPALNIREENEHIKYIKPTGQNENTASCQVEGEQSRKTTLKRKSLSANDTKVQRKRLKAGRSEKTQRKGSAQWSHLSEEELKKLRRVKNRESVEKCRTKQRLRMEALQVEQTCLRLENKNLRDALILIHAALHDASMQIPQIKSEMGNNAEEEEESVEKINETEKEVAA